MSLTTPPKIDWGPEAVADTDMNEIGVNLNSLDAAIDTTNTEVATKQDIITGKISGVTDLQQKIVTGTVSSSSISIAHGLTMSSIKGVSIAPLTTTVTMIGYKIDSTNIVITFASSASGTVNIVVFYV